MITKTISTIKAGQPLDATHFLQVAGNPVNINRIEGTVNSTTGTNYYIQLLSVPLTGAVSGTTVPLFSVLAVPSGYPTAINGFSFIYTAGLDTSRMSYPVSATVGGDNTKPVYIAISSTDTVWTAVAGSTDVAVSFEAFFVDLPNQVIVSSAASSNLTVWNDVSTTTANRLVSFIVDNTNNGTSEFLQLFAQTGPGPTTLPLASWTVPSGVIFTQTFGSGLLCTSEAPFGSQHFGCFLTMSSTKQFYTAPTDSFASMKAAYVALT